MISKDICMLTNACKCFENKLCDGASYHFLLFKILKTFMIQNYFMSFIHTCTSMYLYKIENN